MSNLLKMAKVQSILSLHAQGWPQRRIARELGVDRETVRKYLRQRLGQAKPANAPTGPGASKPASVALLPACEAKPANAPTMLGNASTGEREPADEPGAPALPAGPPSQCRPYHDRIVAKLATGLSLRRIQQDLVDEGTALHYDSLRRYVRRLGKARTLPVRRMERAAGEEAQVDFGTGAPIVGADGRRRTTYVFRIVLSYSRKGYSEPTRTQTTDDFLCALENAFREFGGVPKTLVIDNLKAAVKHPDWFDPELTPKVAAFAAHYGTVILPTKPYTPRHKGKVEAGVKYVKNNALKGRTFESLQAEHRHLAQWETNVADRRIHGTTKQQVAKLFETERAALLPLPVEPFANFHEAQRKVNRDGHVEVAKAYYSVRPEYLGRRVWVRWDVRVVRVFNHRFEQIALHVRREPGRFSTQGEHLHPHKISGLERGAGYLLAKVRGIGPQSHQWAEAMLHARGIEGTRVLQGLLSLAKRHRQESLEKACEIALSHGVYRLRILRQLVKRHGAPQAPLPFLDEHPIIRPLDDYARLVAWDRPSVGESFTRHGWTKERPGQRASADRGVADVLPPRPGYPLSGCSSAEPDSVSPDS